MKAQSRQAQSQQAQSIKTKVLRALGVAAIAASVFVVPGPAALAEDGERLPPPELDSHGRLTLDFEDVELDVFVRFISQLTQRNFVFTDKVTGTVSIVSPTPVSVAEAYDLFQSVLTVRGLTTIDDGVVTRIVPVKDARAMGPGLSGGGDGSGFTTRLLTLHHVDSDEMATVIEPLLSKEGTVVSYRTTNTLVISDTVSNIGKFHSIVTSLDIPGHEQSVEVIRLEYADANDIADQIIEILSSEGRARSKDKERTDRLGFKVVPDQRTNSIVIVATPVDLRRVRALARSLDTELHAEAERIHVYNVRHANADDLADVVAGMISGKRRGAQRSGDAKTTGGTATGLTDEVTITADGATNSLIINASPQDFRTIERLLVSLDVPRAQVFIEAIIIEASITESKALGFDYQLGGDIGDGVGLARANLSNLGAAFVNPASLGGLVLAAASDRTVELPDGTEVPANVALFQALQQATGIEVLSAPTLLTLDNQEAEIVVGQNVPFVTGRAADLASVENVFTTVERRDVGIKLKVQPQVADGDFITVSIEEEVSAVIDSNVLEESLVGPTTTIRTARTTVSVADGHTAVIGGLISNSIQDIDSRVPILGDIPWLGRLFRNNRKSDEKVNLIIFLTPHIVRSARDLEAVSDERREAFREVQPDSVRALPGDPDWAAGTLKNPEDLFPDWPTRPQDPAL